VFEHLHFNLYKFIKVNKHKRPVFEPRQLRRIVYHVSQGLRWMWLHKVIHCDMKPENIIFTDENYRNVKIIDFGASCEDYSSGFFYVQSRYYRAPEIVLGNRYDTPVDIWSLGCIVYELITGRPLFPAKDENELLEYFMVTLGDMPQDMYVGCKKYK
jgi:dual specificity tyrosine-phosphorylation-regulated kinase 2/3/4